MRERIFAETSRNLAKKSAPLMMALAGMMCIAAGTSEIYDIVHFGSQKSHYSFNDIPGFGPIEQTFLEQITDDRNQAVATEVAGVALVLGYGIRFYRRFNEDDSEEVADTQQSTSTLSSDLLRIDWNQVVINSVTKKIEYKGEVVPVLQDE